MEILEQELQEYGGRDYVLKKIVNTDWASIDAKHDWRNVVPPAVQREWNRLSLETRIAVYMLAEPSENMGLRL